ncbi:MAG: flagellar basal body P-ring protein FlgI, partial [Myxococcota bacterium]
VVINERTGTVVMGGRVRIKEIAVAHGNLNVSVSTQFSASQPAAFRGNGDTVVLPDEQVNAAEDASKLYVVQQGATITDVVGALNAIGVTPRDLIAILQAIKEAGALDAELVIQ